MPQSRTDQIIQETISLVASQYNIDSKVVEAVVRSQFSFIKKIMREYKAIRVINLGIFSFKPKYQKMLDDVGYVKRFKGTYAKLKEFIAKNPEHFKRVEESRMERRRSREESKRKTADMCELPTTE